MQIPLSVAIPTYARPDLLRRAIGSLVRQPPGSQAATELVVSDNSLDETSERVYRQLAEGWRGKHRYDRNADAPGMVGNFNRCVERSGGRYVLVLHDDDYLLEGGLEEIHAAIARRNKPAVLLFGVKVVDGEGNVLRRQEFARDRYLPPAAALKRVLQHSSYVRFPAIVVHRDAYAAVGVFEERFGGACDFAMWTRLFGRFGVHTVASTTAAYVVHEEADTTGVFNETTIKRAVTIFDETPRDGLPEETIRRCQADWFHQFILGGAVRRLRSRDRKTAREVLRLFDLPDVRHAGHSLRWLPVRLAVRAVVGRTKPVGGHHIRHGA